VATKLVVVTKGLYPARVVETKPVSHRLISTILRHDRKQNSYKIALLRSLNDVVLSFPGLEHRQRPVAVPLKVLAEFWVAYYWPFVVPELPIMQGVRNNLGEGLRRDMSFRTHLTELRRAWRNHHGGDSPADGFHLINEMRVQRRRSTYSAEFQRQYQNTLNQIGRAIRQPVQYAGPGEWQVFSRPMRLFELPDAASIPGSSPGDVCILIEPDLWAAFHDVSLWVEALIAGPRFSDRPLRWEAVGFQEEVLHEEEASESFTGVQGEGCFGGRQGGEVLGGSLPGVWGSREPDWRLEAPVTRWGFGPFHSCVGA
jgi:hypothetical protein